jgi:hypothetical protein
VFITLWVSNGPRKGPPRVVGDAMRLPGDRKWARTEVVRLREAATQMTADARSHRRQGHVATTYERLERARTLAQEADSLCEHYKL